MKSIKAVFTGSVERAASIKSFRFSCAEKMDFLPGQFLKLIFDESVPEDDELNKYLSFSCSPHRDYVEVTKRITGSKFSSRLQSLKPGDKVTLWAPMGKCIFRPEYVRVGFIAGGIGITPVISIIDYLVHNRLHTDAVLFYSSKTQQEIAFRRELDEWCSGNDRLKVHYTVTDCPPQDHICSYGRIDRVLLENLEPGFKDRTVFIFGPPAMVNEMTAVCREIGCPDSNLRLESFSGY